MTCAFQILILTRSPCVAQEYIIYRIKLTSCGGRIRTSDRYLVYEIQHLFQNYRHLLLDHAVLLASLYPAHKPPPLPSHPTSSHLTRPHPSPHLRGSHALLAAEAPSVRLEISGGRPATALSSVLIQCSD